MSPPAYSRGAIHVAYGPRYLAEARLSAESVRLTNPGLRLGLITGSTPEDPEVWDDIWIVPEEGRGGGEMKLRMHLAPWDRCLFLDTDTLVVDSLEPVFTVLDRFDFAAVQHSGGHHYQAPGLPACFPEFNSGVMGWRRSPRTLQLFARWQELYVRLRPDSGRTWDQQSLRIALFESDLRIANLPHNFNLMPYAHAMLENEPVVLHGRNHSNLARLRTRTTASTQLRSYVPGIGVLHHPLQMRWAEILKACCRMIMWKLLPRRRMPKAPARAFAKSINTPSNP